MHSISIPGYSIEKQIGQGGMATVYQAKEAKLERNVALKVMAGHLLSDPSFADRFLREARIVASISHRNIVSIFDVGSHGDYHYMAMELLPGGDLKDKLSKGVSIESAIPYIKDIAAGLQYASSKGCIHRDIKPENIMFAEDGRAVITDFGIARNTAAATSMTLVGSVIGTPHYMSPEQASAKELDPRSDLYSLGIIVYEILMGKTPFEGDSAISIGIMHLTQEPQPLPAHLQKYQIFINKALSKKPEGRFQNGNEFISALLHIVNAQTGPQTVILTKDDIKKLTGAAKHKGSSANATSHKKKNPAKAMILAGGVIATLGAGAYYFVGSTPQPTGLAIEQATSNAQTANRINKLIIQASSQLLNKQYVAPLNDNALATYQKIIALNPNNGFASSGLSTLSQMLIMQASNAIDNDKLTLADSFLNDAQLVKLNQPKIDKLKDNISLAKQEKEKKRTLENEAKTNRQLEKLRLAKITKANLAEKDRLAKLENKKKEEKARLSTEITSIEYLIAQKEYQQAINKADNELAKNNNHRQLAALKLESTKKLAEKLINSYQFALVRTLLGTLDKNQAEKETLILILDTAKEQYQEISVVTSSNIKALAKEYQIPGFLDDDSVERERLRRVYADYSSAYNNDPNHPDITKFSSKLINKYVAIINQNMAKGKTTNAQDWKNDALSYKNINLDAVKNIEIKSAQKARTGNLGF